MLIALTIVLVLIKFLVAPALSWWIVIAPVVFGFAIWLLIIGAGIALIRR